MANLVKIIFDAVDNTGRGVKSVNAGLAKVRNAAFAVTATVTGMAVAVNKAVTAFTGYADQVNAVARVTGATAEESSRLIQVTDDLFISYESLALAMKGAVQHGIEPSIESLAELSTQYLALAPGLSRSAFLLDKFGKSGLEMGKMLEQGGEKIREMVASVPEGLILNKDDIKIANELKVSFDGVGDAWQSFVNTAVSGSAPATIALVGFFETAIAKGEEFYTKYMEWADKTKTEMKAQMLYEASIGNLSQIQMDAQGVGWLKLDDSAKKYWTDMAQSVVVMGDATHTTRVYTLAQYEAAKAAGEFGDAMEGVGEQIEDMDMGGKLNFVMSFQSSFEGFEKTKNDLTAKLAELQTEWDNVQSGMQNWTIRKVEGQEQLEDIKKKMQDVSGELSANEQAWLEWQNQAVFSIVQTKLAADGLTDIEFNQLLGFGEQLGVLDSSTVDRAIALFDAASSVDPSGLEHASAAVKKISDMDMAGAPEDKKPITENVADLSIINQDTINYAKDLMTVLSDVDPTNLDLVVRDIRFLVGQDGRTITLYVNQEVTTVDGGTTTGGNAPTQNLSGGGGGQTFINYGPIYPASMGGGDILAEFR